MLLDLQGPAPAALDAPCTAHVWSVSLAVCDATLEALRAILSPDECARADRFVFERDRRAFTVSHGALRQVLARYARRDPAALCFGERRRGKPWLHDSPDGLEFNLSHSGGHALVGVTRNAAIGVDVEAHRPMQDMYSLARHCFAADEVRELQALPLERHVQAFYNAWTRKEAYIKATGEGLACPLESFEVTMAPGEAARLRSINGSAVEAARWSMHAFSPAPGVTAAVVIGGRNFTLQHGCCTDAGRMPVAVGSENSLEPARAGVGPRELY